MWKGGESCECMFGGGIGRCGAVRVCMCVFILFCLGLTTGMFCTTHITCAGVEGVVAIIPGTRDS